MPSTKRKQDEMCDDTDELLFLISNLIVKHNNIQIIIDSVIHLFENKYDCEDFVKIIYQNYVKAE